MSSDLLNQILHSKKVAYKNFIPLTKPYLDYNKKMQNVNIFVDVYDILKQLYNPQTIENLSNLKHKERFIIASEIINIVSHYRHFFASRYEKFTTFYFFCSTKESSYMKDIYPEYKKDFYDKRLNINHQLFGVINNIVLWSFRLIKNIMQFIPHVYFIDTGVLEPNIIPNFILNNIVKDDDVNMIISNDELFYQDLLIKDDSFILELRGEKTRIITRENMFDYLLSSTKKSFNDYPNILPEMLNIIIPLISHKNYNIPSIRNMGITRALSFVSKGIDKNFISTLSEYRNNEELWTSLKNSGLKDEEIEKYKINYSLVNHKEIIDRNYKNYENIIDINLIERQDAEGLRITNEKYFSGNPILLDYCFEGEEYSN